MPTVCGAQHPRGGQQKPLSPPLSCTRFFFLPPPPLGCEHGAGCARLGCETGLSAAGPSAAPRGPRTAPIHPAHYAGTERPPKMTKAPFSRHQTSGGAPRSLWCEQARGGEGRLEENRACCWR